VIKQLIIDIRQDVKHVNSKTRMTPKEKTKRNGEEIREKKNRCKYEGVTGKEESG